MRTARGRSHTQRSQATFTGPCSRTARSVRPAPWPTSRDSKRRSGRHRRPLTASGASSRALELPNDTLRVIYLDGAGCYGMNGHDDAAADAALLSKAVDSPCACSGSRQDELGWDPKGPPQLLDTQGARRCPTAASMPGRPRCGCRTPRRAWSGYRCCHCLPRASGKPGVSTGLISQNGDPPYARRIGKSSRIGSRTAPLRPSNIRAPGKVANCFAVESFTDDARVRRGAIRWRSASDVSDPRGAEVHPARRGADRLEDRRPSPATASARAWGAAWPTSLQEQRELRRDGDGSEVDARRAAFACGACAARTIAD